ncbi:LURP-one-related/scramblase family protein [Limosilactobacillus difficilis]|uniref:LURP-one-related/scramblase family protein n=1 Tax=Limosilactobacillus difficilis TaxID=2991838 RepID=UPI0024BB0D67|nr:hypothetical protein [Limosilactobacillus difficilis]
MRKLYLRDRATDSSATVICDQDGQQIYLLTGKWGFRHDALSLYTMSGDLLAEVRQLSLGITPKFALYQNHQRVGTVGKSLGFLKEIVYIQGISWLIVGNGINNHYRFLQGSRLIATLAPVDKTGLNVAELKVYDQADEPLAILVATILNHWSHNGDKAPLISRFRQRFGRKISSTFPCNFAIHKLVDELHHSRFNSH